MSLFSWIVFGVTLIVGVALPWIPWVGSYYGRSSLMLFDVAMALSALYVVATHEGVMKGWISDILDGDFFGFERAEREERELARKKLEDANASTSPQKG